MYLRIRFAVQQLTEIRRILGPVLVLSLAGCPNPPSDRITGQSTSDPTYPSPKTQSETIINVSNLDPFTGQQVITVSYNDDFDTSTTAGGSATIIQGATTRTVLPGATTLGWSYSTDGAQTWAYGGEILPVAKLGAQVLWGDPSITHSRKDAHFVFIGNLMVPTSKKMPPGGIVGNLSGFIAGGCFAKSSDGGMTFSLYQCVLNKSVLADGDLYDGGSIEAGNNGEFYAAWWNLSAQTIDVWEAPNESGSFTLQSTQPFPGLAASNHPELRYDPDNGSLYALAPINITPNAPTETDQLFINRWDGSKWGTATPASSADLAIEPFIGFSGGALRRAAPFSFDIGPGEGMMGSTGPATVRLLYTAHDKRFFIKGFQCDLTLHQGCSPIPEWGTGSSDATHVPGDQFSPLVRLARPTLQGGLSGLYEWKASWFSREQDVSGNTFVIVQGNMTQANGQSLLLGEPVFGPLTPCPSRTVGTTGGSDYWGDYDDLQTIGTAAGTTSPAWLQTFSDSSQGCQYQWVWTSYHVHVSNVTFE